MTAHGFRRTPFASRLLRQRVAAIPDGEYRAEGFLDDDGRNCDSASGRSHSVSRSCWFCGSPS